MNPSVVKNRAQQAETLSRYSRQMILPVIGVEGQEVLSNSKVLVVGAGGIGSTVLMYLVSSGVPVTVLDFDTVDISNLHRQIIHDTANAGINKAVSAAARLGQINPSLRVHPVTEKLTSDNAQDIIAPFDLVVDATDNFEARYLINDACVLNDKPLISGSAVGLEGQATVFIPRLSACYRCLYPGQSFAESCRSCANAGVLGPVPGLIGCLQAIEAIKLLLLRGSAKDSAAVAQLECLVGRQTLYDASNGSFFTFSLPPRSPDCAVCGTHPTILSVKDTQADLAQSQCRNAEVMKTIVPVLDAVHCRSVSQFRDALLAGDHPTLVLDVRSAVQFQLSSLVRSELFEGADASRLLVHPSLDACADAMRQADQLSRGQVHLVSVPLDTLKGGKAAAAEQIANKERQMALLREISICLGDSSPRAVEVFVLCRRGIDSSTATQLLRDQLQDEQVDFLNVSGGLTAWKGEVEPSLPFY